MSFCSSAVSLLSEIQSRFPAGTRSVAHKFHSKQIAVLQMNLYICINLKMLFVISLQIRPLLSRLSDVILLPFALWKKNAINNTILSYTKDPLATRLRPIVSIVPNCFRLIEYDCHSHNQPNLHFYFPLPEKAS